MTEPPPGPAEDDLDDPWHDQLGEVAHTFGSPLVLALEAWHDGPSGITRL